MAETETEETTASHSQMWKHEAMVEWAKTEEGGGVDLDTMSASEIIAWAFANRGTKTSPGWRQTQTYRDLVDGRAESVAAEKAAAAAEKAAAREAAKAAKAAEKAAAKKAAPAKKAAAKKAAPAPAKRAAKKAAATTAEDPFA